MRKKTYMRKIITFLLICTMLLTLGACGKKDNSDIQKSAPESSSVDVSESLDNTEPDLVETSSNEDEPDVEESDAEEPDTGEMVEQTPEPEEMVAEKTPLEPEEIYSQVLDGYYADLVSEFPIDNYFPMTLGTFESTLGSTPDTLLNGVGYTMMDINGDGTQELLIMEVSDQGQTSYFGERILAMYTIENDEALFLEGGWARNRFYLLNDGSILNEGSSGADDSSFDVYIFHEQSRVLELIDSKDSKADDYVQQLEELKKLIEKVEIKSFAEYETSKDYPESAKEFWSAVYVNPAEKTFAYPGSDSYVADDSEYAMDLVFFTPSEVSEFKFNSLTPVNMDDGGISYTEEELYSLESLVMDKAVKITMEFVGDTPNYGISYKDAGGNERRYAICMSGFDGSIYLSRYDNVQ